MVPLNRSATRLILNADTFRPTHASNPISTTGGSTSSSSPSRSRSLFARVPQVSVGAFGKHPGWNDHIDDLGLDTQRLTEFKRLLYVDGIAACVESGQWDKLTDAASGGSPGAALEEFDHLFVARAGGPDNYSPSNDYIIGRMWSSQDGKGRARYPMVVCVHAMNLSLADALTMAIPALDALASRCRQSTDAAEVVAFVDAERHRLRAEAVRIGSAASPAAPSLQALIDHPDLGPSRRGLYRILYQLERELAPFLRTGPRASRVQLGVPQSRQIRLPACGGAPYQVLAQWSGFLDTRLEPGIPLMLIWPRTRAWLDVIIGEPNGPQMFCLRASDTAMPPVSQVPYTIDQSFAAHAEQVISDILGAAGPQAQKQPVADSPGVPVSGGGGAMKKLAIVVVLLIILGGALVVLFGAGPVAQPVQAAPQPAAEVQSPAIRAALDRQRDLATGPAADRAREYLLALDRSIPRAIRRSGTPPVWLANINEQLTLIRERRLERVLGPWLTTAVDPALAGATDDLDREARDLTALYKRAAVLTDEMAAADRLLDNAYGSSEQPPAGDAAAASRPATLREIAAPWRSRIAEEPLLRGLVAAVLDRIDALINIEGTSDTDPLVAAIGANAPDRPELTFAAWRRLAERPGVLWPATLADVDTDAATAARLKPMLDRLPDIDRRKLLQAELAASQKRRLLRFLSFAPDPRDIEEGFSRLGAFGVRVEELDPWLQYNHHINALKQDSKRLADPELRGELKMFLDQVKAMPGGIAYRAEAAPVISGLEAILAGREPEGRPAWWTNLGPAATGRFTVALADHDRLVFTPMLGDGIGGTPIEFVLYRPDPASGLESFYLSAAEVSVSIFSSIHAAAVASAAASTPPLPRYMLSFAPDDDPRFGPRSWEWAQAYPPRTLIRPAREWLLSTGRATADDYPPGTVPPRPSPDSPMQHIGPKGAACFPALAGCRLPTEAEWRFAASVDGPASLDGANLRDQTWLRYFAHTQARLASGRSTQQADAGAFNHSATAPGAARENDDGVLWFSPSPPNAEVSNAAPHARHLIGNVAEFVLAAPQQAANPPTADPREPAAAAYFAKLNFMVAGGSALSDPAADPRVPVPLKLEEAGEGFSDVGFRLAFSGRHLGPDAATLAARVERLLSPTPFLKGR